MSRKLLEIPHYRVLAGIIGATTLSLLAFFLVLLKLNPFESPSLAIPFFIISLTLSLTGIFTTLLFYIKKWKSQNEVYLKHLMISLRQGLLLSLTAALCLLLLMFGILRIWNGVLILILVTLLEFYLSGKDELN